MADHHSSRKRKKADAEKISRSEQMEGYDDNSANETDNTSFQDVMGERYGRRFVMKALLGAGLVGVGSYTARSYLVNQRNKANSTQFQKKEGGFHFEEIQGGVDQTHHVAKGYDVDIFLRWGDALFPDSPPFDPFTQSPESQLKQFGYNNDFIGFFPLNGSPNQGLLCVNHEYTIDELMFPDIGNPKRYDFSHVTRQMVDIEMAAHGGTVIEIYRENGQWQKKLNSRYNRRINALNTEMIFDGPAAGHALLKTASDPAGNSVIGTINNCAGGITPWGTYLMSEENFHLNFYTDQVKQNGKPKKGLGGAQKAAYKRYRLPGQFLGWGRFHERFNIDKTPNEPNRFGWVVEVDLLNPDAKPVKHTAMGRFCHEGCENIITKDGYCVVYMGDDTKFEYVYKFVSLHKYQKDHGDKALRQANLSLLSEGTLYVARFNADGSLDWLPMVHGQNGLIEENGFASQAEVLIHARMAADHLGATPMDRPEDIEPDKNGKVYVMLTNNNKRNNSTRKVRKHTNAANKREKNDFGHIIEIAENEANHAALKARWDIVVQCGDPAKPELGAKWHRKTSKNGWFGSPDNCVVDPLGRLWVATDQGRKWNKTGKADGLYALETSEKLRGYSQMFFRVPVGAELCGPCFLPDMRALFLSVQHPGSDGTVDFKGFGRLSTFLDPATRWPDFKDGMPPRPAVVMITKKDGGTIG